MTLFKTYYFKRKHFIQGDKKVTKEKNKITTSLTGTYFSVDFYLTVRVRVPSVKTAPSPFAGRRLLVWVRCTSAGVVPSLQHGELVSVDVGVV